MNAPRAVVRTTIPNLAQPGTIFDLLNFRIAEIINVSGSLVTRLCEGELGLTRDEWAFIGMMAALGPLSPSELAAETTVDASQVSRSLRSLSQKELIVREPVPGDARRARIRLSAAGVAMYRKAFPRVVEVHHEVLSSLTDAERETLARCLWKIQIRAHEVQQAGLVQAQAHRRSGGSRKSWVPPGE